MKLLTALFLSLVFFYASCYSGKGLHPDINRMAIPADIKDSSYILLVQKPTWSKSITRLTEKYMRNYAGKWEFVDLEEINNPRYADTTRYRYLLRQNPDTKAVESIGGAVPGGSNASQSNRTYWESRSNKYVYADHIFVDRRLIKTYPPTGLIKSDYAWPLKFLIPYINQL